MLLLKLFTRQCFKTKGLVKKNQNNKPWPSGLELIKPGVSFKMSLHSTIDPEIGIIKSLAAFTLSTVPKTSVIKSLILSDNEKF